MTAGSIYNGDDGDDDDNDFSFPFFQVRISLLFSSTT